MNQVNVSVTKDGWKVELHIGGKTYVQTSQMIDDNTATAPTIDLYDLLEKGIIDEDMYHALDSIPMDIAMSLREMEA